MSKEIKTGSQFLAAVGGTGWLVYISFFPLFFVVGWTEKLAASKEHSLESNLCIKSHRTGGL